MQLAEMFVKLGFKIDSKTLNNFSKNVDTAINNIGKITAGATAFVVAMDKITESVARGVNNLENFNAQTGLSIGKLQQLQITAGLQNIGLSADSVSQSIQSLQSNLAEIRLGQGNIAPFQMLGIDVLGQDAFGVLDQLREKIKGVDDMVATNLISQMGLNPQFITVLRMSKDEFSQLNSQIALTADERENIMKLGVEVKKIHLIIQALISKTLSKWSPVIMEVAKHIENIVKSIGRFNMQIPVMVVGLGGVLKMFKMLNATTASWALALTGLFLLLDDFAVWSQGGKSVLDYSGLQKFFDAVIPQIERFADAINSIKDKKLTALFSVLGAIAGGVIGGVFTGGPGIIPGAVAGGVMGAGGGSIIDLLRSPNAEQSIKNITQTNNYSIHSNATDGQDVARAIQPQMDNAVLQTTILGGDR